MHTSVPISRDAEAMENDEIPANRFFPPSDDFGRPGSGFEPPYFTSQPQGGTSVDDAYELESATTSSSEEDTYQYVNTRHMESYNTRGAPSLITTLGVNYANFYKAFGQSPKSSQCGPASATTTSAQRPAAKSKSARRRIAIDDRVSSSNQARQPSPLVPSKRSAPNFAEESRRIKVDPPARSDLDRDRAISPKGVARVVEKGNANKARGSGLYTRGNWAWISDEEDGGKVDEKILAEARQIAAIAEASSKAPAKMTRRQLQDLKSKASGPSPATVPDPGQRSSLGAQSTQTHAEKGFHPSRRVSRTAVNYSESNLTEDGDEPTLPTKQRTPSTLDSSVSHGSTPVPGEATRSTSASTVPHQADPKPTQLTRPKMSWNAIVYEVFTNSALKEMTLAEVQQGVKDRFPFFALPENVRTLESSPRNPLYMHPSFYKTQRADGKIAWGLLPGEFLDKKTGKVLNPGAKPATDSIESIKPSEDSQPDIEQTPSTPHLQTPPASNGGAGPVTTTSREHSSMDPASERSLHKIANEEDEANRDNSQDQELPRAVSRNSPQEVPETQLPRILPQEVIETQLPRSSPQEVLETQQPSLQQASAASVSKSTEQCQFEDIVRNNLTEIFEAKELEWFLQQTKLWYFKNMVLAQSDIACILNDLFPVRETRSTDADMAACARDLQDGYQHSLWASDWLAKFIKDNVTQFDKMNEGFLKYTDLTKPKRLNFWLARSMWNRETCVRILSALSDAVDIEKVWTTKHWHDFVEKLYTTACDATCELRGQEHVFREIKAALDERYPERNTPTWNVPTLKSALAKANDRKMSIAASGSATRPGSAASSVHHTPVKGNFSSSLPWFGPLSATKKSGGTKENSRASSIAQENTKATTGDATIDLS